MISAVQQPKPVASDLSPSSMSPNDTILSTNRIKQVTVKHESNNKQSLDSMNIGNKNERLDLGSMIEEFISILGKESWTKYAQILSFFVLGKLSRRELTNQLDSLFDASIKNIKTNNDDNDPENNENTSIIPHINLRPRLIRLHNQLLLGIFTNSLRDSPLGSTSSKSWGFQNGSNASNKSLKRVNKHNSQIETYKKIVMSLPISDRNRLKLITKESGKRGFIYCSVLQGRLNNIPKIPIVTNPETLKRVKTNNLKTPLEWSQDIMNGYNAPLSTDNFSLPDTDTLYLKMTGVAREHGLVGSVDTRCVELVSMALDQYLKKIVEFGIDAVRYREKKYSDYYDLGDDGIYRSVAESNSIEPARILDDIAMLKRDSIPNSQSQNTNGNDDDKIEIDSEVKENIGKLGKMSLTNEDIYKAVSIFPNLMKSTSSVYFNLSDNGLKNDDELVIMKSTIDDLPEFLNEKPMFTPLDDKNIGTREELNWLIKDILTEE